MSRSERITELEKQISELKQELKLLKSEEYHEDPTFTKPLEDLTGTTKFSDKLRDYIRKYQDDDYHSVLKRWDTYVFDNFKLQAIFCLGQTDGYYDYTGISLKVITRERESNLGFITEFSLEVKYDNVDEFIEEEILTSPSLDDEFVKNLVCTIIRNKFKMNENDMQDYIC